MFLFLRFPLNMCLKTKKIKATVTFTTPLLLDRLDILSRPVSYVAYNLESKTGEPVKFIFGISTEICVNDYDRKVKFGRT